MRPRFNTLWDKPWPYDASEGVGLRLQGLPHDEREFIKYLASNSCHPSAGKRILERIKTHGFDLLTVMAVSLNFDTIAVTLKSMGVQMSIIPPQPGWYAKYQDGEYPPEFML